MAHKKGPKGNESQKEKIAENAARLPNETVGKWSWVEPTVTSLAWIILVATVWAEPRPVGDYFIALAAGRDMIATGFSCLTQPDTWSFTTDGRVWMNQNWGTHLMYFLAYDLGGGAGAMGFKALVLAVMAGAVVMVCRQRGVGLPLAILIGGVAVGAGRSFIDLRPHLMTFVFTPVMVWLIYRSRSRPRRVWAAAVVGIIWANTHGGFIFGLGLMSLWALCWVTSLSLARGFKATLATYWHVPAAALVTVLASGTLSPYGLENLTHPFLVGWSAEWRTISEWRPIYEVSWLGSTWEFYALVTLLVALSVLCGLVVRLSLNGKHRQLPSNQFVLLVFSVCLCVTFWGLAIPWQINPGVIYQTLRQARWLILIVGGAFGAVGGLVVITALADQAKGKQRLARPNAEALATSIFELCLAGVVIIMAVMARRFIPLAIIVLAPIVALQVQWLLETWDRTWPVAFAAFVLVLLTLLSWQSLYKYYHPNNPILPPHSTFQRMMAYGSYPSGAKAFIRENHVAGNAFNKWTWEGYLHWQCPDLKLFLGGRAQQVYSLETYRQRNSIMAGGVATSAFAKQGVHLAVIPDNFRYRRMVRDLVSQRDSRWAYVYYDGINAILADGAHDNAKKLIDKAASGHLEYPDPAIEAMSRARCLSSKLVGADDSEVAAHIMRANALKPTQKGYNVLRVMVQRGLIPQETALPYLYEQSQRLENMPVDGAGGFEILACRQGTAEMLSILYGRAKDPTRAAQWSALAAEYGRQMATMQNRWQSKYALICYPYLSGTGSGGNVPRGHGVMAGR